MKKGNITTQNGIVIAFLRKNRKKLTSEAICKSINSSLPRGKKRFTTTQISKCLNRFSERDMVEKIDNNGTHSTGRLVATWKYVAGS